MKVFLSHSDADRELASALFDQLAVQGLEVSNAESSLLPGDNWHERASEALKSSDAMVVLYSPEYSKSPWSRSELSFALGEKAYRDRVIPVLVRPTETEPWVFKHLRTLQFEGDPARLAEEIEHALAAVDRGTLITVG